jgi:DNA (cytosine-5)-methyltransferase 1
MKEIIRFFDCFAGIGGFYQGAMRIKNDKYSFKHVAYCEVEKNAQRFYEKACAAEGVQFISDVKDIKTKKNPEGTEVVEYDMLFAGFPCQSFSNVGYRKGFDDPRGQLFFYILDMLDYYQPKYFVLENVQKIHTIKNGSLLDEMKTALKEIGNGYVLHTWNLLASDYGLPQKRNRIFFCGIRADIADEKDITEPPKIDLKEAKYPTTWHLLEKGDVDKKHYIPSGSRKTILTKPSNWQGDVNIDNPIARPITATMSKWHRANQDNYYSDAYIKGNDPYKRPKIDIDTEPIRRITPLEGYRLQGFADEYSDIGNELKIAYSAQYKLIGNALPVDLAYSVIKHFLDSYIG